GDGHAGLLVGQRDAHGHLAVLLFAEHAAVLARHADRVPSLFRGSPYRRPPRPPPARGVPGPPTLSPGRCAGRPHRPRRRSPRNDASTDAGRAGGGDPPAPPWVRCSSGLPADTAW